MRHDVDHTTGTLTSFDGTRLAFHAWQPQEATSGPIALIHHGAAYHGGAYGRLGRVLAGNGIPSLALDARGHGLSEGARGELVAAGTLLRDLQLVATAWRGLHPGRPMVLIGESMGGLVTLLYAARARNTRGRADALVLSAPGILIQPHQVFNRDSLTALPRSLLHRTDASFARPAERDANNVQRYPTTSPGEEAEQLALHGFSASYIWIVSGMSVKSPQAAWRVGVPTLIVHGKKDDVVPYQSSRLLYRMLRTPDKEISLYPDDGHTLFWSQEESPIYEDLLGWIGTRFELVS